MDKKLETEHKIVTSISGWETVADYFSCADWVGLDTEFMRDRTYYPQLCLVQLSSPEINVCIDTLAFDCSAILTAFFADKNITKVIHSASQDIEVLGYYCNSTIHNIYDTQLAAEFCGLNPQMGYAALVKELLKIELPKSQTRSNWAKRPLTSKQIEYSLNDVRYLKDLYDLLNSRLVQQNKLAWFNQEQELELERMSRFRIEPSQAYKSFKSSHRLAAQNQQVIKQLVVWREQMAQAINKPKNWILSDKSITEIGKTLPHDFDSLQLILADDLRFKKQYSGDVMRCIQQGLKQPNELIWEEREQLSEPQKQQVKELRRKLGHIAAEHQIPVTRLATRKDVVDYVRDRRGRLAEGWRGEIIKQIFVSKKS